MVVRKSGLIEGLPQNLFQIGRAGSICNVKINNKMDEAQMKNSRKSNRKSEC